MALQQIQEGQQIGDQLPKTICLASLNLRDSNGHHHNSPVAVLTDEFGGFGVWDEDADVIWFVSV